MNRSWSRLSDGMRTPRVARGHQESNVFANVGQKPGYLFRLVCIDAFLQELAPSYARPSLQLCLFTTSAKSFVSPLSRKVDIDLKCIHLTFGEFECTFGVLPLSSNSSVCRAVLDDLERELLNSIDGGVGARITRPLTDSLAYLFPLFSVSSFSFLVAHVEQRWPCTSVCARVVTPGL